MNCTEVFWDINVLDKVTAEIRLLEWLNCIAWNIEELLEILFRKTVP